MPTQSSNASYPGYGLEKQISNWSDEINVDESTRRVNVVTPLLAATLDRTGVTSRNASHILLAFATGQGMKVDQMNLSSSAIEQQRIKERCRADEKRRESIEFPNHLVVHWDGKSQSEVSLMKEGKKNEKKKEVVERLPILVTGSGTEQLLECSKLSSGTGMNISSAVVRQLRDWKIADRVQAMCFDTTSSNTGKL